VSVTIFCCNNPFLFQAEQLGIVMMGITVGFLLGPTVGGTLNDKLGYRAPFILGMIVCTVDLMGRLFIIEKHDAARWIPQESNGEVDTASGMHSLRMVPSRVY
jgi:MFS transporter, DHA1 family, solute carrier family 18 (vesicular amine transporter), member 1/2